MRFAYCHGENLSLAEIARRTGISAGYASQLARDYGVPVRGLKDYSVSQHPVLTRDWLTGRYVTRGLSLRAIAAEAGMSKSAVKRWVKIYRLPAPGTRFPIRMDILAAVADAPSALRPAISGPGAWKRLRRLAAASSYSSLTEAGAGLGIESTVLVSQINRLERELGHRLLDRVAGQRTMQPAEPLLGPIDMGLACGGPAPDWLIIGGESGPGARPMDLAWARDLLRQCQQPGVTTIPFVKQLGAVTGRHLSAGPKGGNWDAWPEDLKLRGFPRPQQPQESN